MLLCLINLLYFCIVCVRVCVLPSIHPSVTTYTYAKGLYTYTDLACTYADILVNACRPLTIYR